MLHNPYIPLIENVPNLLSNPQIIQSWKGRWHEYFGNNHPRILEIGTGLGNYFSQEVMHHPERNFIGIEIKFKRLYMTAKKSNERASVSNFVVIKAFGQEIDEIFAPEELNEIIIFFPDPWGKKRVQKKHKLMQTPFLEVLFGVLASDGKVFFKTDHRVYFDEVVALFQSHGGFEVVVLSYDYEIETEHFDSKRLTEFESMYRAEKLPIHYLVVSKKHTKHGYSSDSLIPVVG